MTDTHWTPFKELEGDEVKGVDIVPQTEGLPIVFPTYKLHFFPVSSKQ